MKYIYIYLIGLFAFCSCAREADFKKQTVDYLRVEDGFLEVSTVADSLEVPWGMGYLNDKIIFTQIKGKVKQVDLKTGELRTLLSLDDVFHRTTPGLLGLAIQKNNSKDPFVFLVFTQKQGTTIVANLVRYTYDQDTLTNPVNLLTIKGGKGHNGSRVVCDQNNMLYWATGDAADNTQAQDSTTLNGKILRMHMDGSIPKDNPIKDSYVYAWGFRNIQGLTMDDMGNIFSSEHGDAVEDEVNLIHPLANYGWPQIEGIHDTPAEKSIADSAQRTEPIKSWTPVIAPAGLAYYGHEQIHDWQNSLLLVTLKSQSLRVLKLGENNTVISQEKVYFSNRYGRLRAVLAAPNGDVYVSTSNLDWNPQPGFPLPKDDRILRIRKSDHVPDSFISQDEVDPSQKLTGELLYKNYCASCHKNNGMGLKGSFPALKGSKRVQDSKAFIQLLLKGSKGDQPIDGVQYKQGMASFSFLNDQQLTQIVNYVNQKFADGQKISPTDIKNER